MANTKSWDKWATTPTSHQARAYLGTGDIGITFPFNPDTVSWDYSENVFSQDTLGGRVVQLLSVGINGMTVAGRAGSRKELQKMAKAFKEVMGFHVSTLEPVYFKVPSRDWLFKVYLQAVPQLSWEVASTSYPYQLQLLIEEDLNGVKTHQINSEALKRLASGIGYDYSKDIHGGDAALLKKQYDIVNAAANVTTGVNSGVSGALAVGSVASTVAQKCTGKGCTINAFMVAVANYVGVNPSPQILTILIAWAAREGGSIHNSATYNPLNTTYDGGLKIGNTGIQGNIAIYGSFADGVKATGMTLRGKGHGYEKIIAAMKSGNPSVLAKAINDSDWCGPCYGTNGSALLGDYSSYGNEVLP